MCTCMLELSAFVDTGTIHLKSSLAALLQFTPHGPFVYPLSGPPSSTFQQRRQLVNGSLTKGYKTTSEIRDACGRVFLILSCDGMCNTATPKKHPTLYNKVSTFGTPGSQLRSCSHAVQLSQCTAGTKPCQLQAVWMLPEDSLADKMPPPAPLLKEGWSEGADHSAQRLGV